MLIQCPECNLQVSDKAWSCPHCGYPMKGEIKLRKERSKKRRRLPNGFGQISEIKGKNLRKPFRAMITTGKDPFGKPICKPLKPESYFESYNDAYMALVEYNKDPYDVISQISVKELFERWKESSNNDFYDYCFSFCSNIFDLPARELRTRHIKECMAAVDSPRLKANIKTLFNLLMDYAIEYEIVVNNCSRAFKIPKEVSSALKEVKNQHIVFSEDEISSLWAHSNDDFLSRLILIQCYSGWRPKELLNIRLENVDLDKWTFKGGMKTEAGKNRLVPIHTKIRELVRNEYERSKSINAEYLFSDFKYNQFYYQLTKLISYLGLNPDHRPHDGRKHFITQAKKYNVDEYAIKYLVGHYIEDLTERVYTERDIEWLRSELEKIK